MDVLLHNAILKKSSQVGLLCNQTAWHLSEKAYLFQTLMKKGVLRKVFIPEHGLFGELQDQLKLDTTSIYRYLGENIEWISLYGHDESSLAASKQQLAGLDTLIIDLQDTGSRYYTFITTIWFLLKTITVNRLSITVIVLDKPNPAGRQVEGTRLKKEFASFIGLEGLPHRHGLTLGELCRYFKNRLQADWELQVIPARRNDHVFIPPSPNIPNSSTCFLYSGQCLWEGTNISEGRGTTLPFLQIGAPFLEGVFKEDWNNKTHPAYNKNALLRPTKFIPVFHKYANEVCSGLHLLLSNPAKYHSLSHSLKLMRYLKSKAPEFSWKEGKYEALNDRKAIELLAGDQLILDYLDEKIQWNEVKEKLEEEEKAWIKEALPFLIYKSSLQQVKIK